MALLNPNQFRQINPLNNLPTLESQVIGGVERKVLSYLFPNSNGAPRKSVGAAVTTFNVDTFRANLNKHNETARADKFNVMFGIPAGLAAIYPGLNMQDLSFQCENSELPGRDIQTIDSRAFGGMIERLPHHNQYGQASFTFIVTGDMWEKIYFDNWFDFMIPAASGLVTYPMTNDNMSNYEADIICNQYDLQGQLVYSIALEGAMPTNISQLPQAWDNDAPHKLSVQFQFKKWLPMPIGEINHQVATPLSRVPAKPTGPPGLLSTITNTITSSLDQRVAQAAGAGVVGTALGAGLKAI